MRTLYEILEVSPTATKDEIKRAYKNKAMKTHPDRFTREGVSPEERKQAELEFQKVNAAYEVLSNDATRQQYDRTGQVPNNSSLGASPQSASARPQAQDPFSHPFFNQGFGFGADSFFHDANRFGTPFGGFGNSRGFGNMGFGSAFDVFNNDPFFNPRMRQRTQAPNMFGGFPDPDQLMHDFMQPPLSRAFGNRLFDPPAFPFQATGQQAMNGNVHSSFFSSSTTSTYQNGRWISESHEESNVDGVSRKQSQRSWMDADGIQHTERIGPDGSSRYLRNGVEEQRPGALPAPQPLVSEYSARTRRSNSRRD
ncbi:SubName: Full=Uncharacterized protein {ECO:0000313/EMBL:CCA72217.1} [Serendipita indica DSM 11827]|uniref:J domain-containing protein n=1 Tax=Serendipita indica (strain DSM 11827) TaxID=1109443 RepID=G4TLM6_SERID|nr:SubName: Full=Uncharacterized protein {ECO:0000313/EMBL:CCA72217.1} [Serendipita indica DSM 11827]CCA72217.1 hypothetical protein PIIN_06152 [Serendipita indica DSM 11827]